MIFHLFAQLVMLSSSEFAWIQICSPALLKGLELFIMCFSGKQDLSAQCPCGPSQLGNSLMS